MEAKHHHPHIATSPPISAQQPHIVRHYRAFQVSELPEDYPYHLEPSSEQSTKINVPYYEFRGKGPPPTDIGKLGDLYLDLTDVKSYALYVLTRMGWTMWDPLPAQSGTVPPVPELLAHPQSSKLNRYLWCDGCQLGWYSLTSLGRMRSRMRHDGIYRVKGGLTEEYNSGTVATEVIRRMLEAEDTVPQMVGRNRKSISSLKDSKSTPRRKKAKLSTHSSPSIESISEADVSTDRPLSWKIKLTPYYSASTPLPAEHTSGSATQGLPNATRELPSDVDEDDAQNFEGGEEGQRIKIKALIEEKSLYEEENQRLKERVLQLIAQTDRLRDTISKTSYVDVIKSCDIQRNSLSRSVSPELNMLNSIIISSTDMLKTAGVELKNARLETQKVRLELESIQLEANLQHNRNNARFTNALATKDKEIEILHGKFNEKVSQLELQLLAGTKRWEQEKAARALAERKFSDLATRVKQFKDTILS